MENNEMTEKTEEKEVVSRNFIEQEIDKILQRAFMIRYTPDSRRNRTDICISDMPRVFF